MRIYLIGFMGCGKSTTAKKLAAEMNVPVMDVDKRIEEVEGKIVSEIFAMKGEEYFRKLETSVLQHSTFFDDAIISCGGGTPCFFGNMDWMKKNGLTVYLKSTPEFLFSRLALKKYKRPLIAHMNDEELLKFIKGKLQEREKFYLQADLIYQSQGIDIDDLLIKIRKSL
ncbi:MAG: shikimate kinase [Chitinophagales bacterium]